MKYKCPLCNKSYQENKYYITLDKSISPGRVRPVGIGGNGICPSCGKELKNKLKGEDQM